MKEDKGIMTVKVLWVKMFILLLATLLIASCSGVRVYKAYSGPELARDKIAILSVTYPIYADSIDGESIPHKRYSGLIELLPGKHVISFGYSEMLQPARYDKNYVLLRYAKYCSSTDRVEQEVDAKPGRVYRVTHNIENNSRCWGYGFDNYIEGGWSVRLYE